LGPPTLVAEVPVENAPARALFESCGWREERRYVDLVLDSAIASPAPPGVVVPVTVDDLIDLGLPALDAPRSWARTRATLINRKERLLGFAVALGDRLDASVLYTREDDAGIAIWSLYVAPGGGSDGTLEILMRDLAHREHGRLAIPRVHEGEISLGFLRGLGFTGGREMVGVAADAKSRA
jgi:ribosomal protein S18 acetylase RimI-like enzyme